MSLKFTVPENTLKCKLQDHFYRTKELFESADKHAISNWFLNKGYYPEQQIVPPNFTVESWQIQEYPCYCKCEILGRKSNKINSKSLVSLSYPKTNLVTRDFSIIWPPYYHDLVWYLIFDDTNRGLVTQILFSENTKIYSYSIPIPLIDGLSVPPSQTELGKLRAGRMIYQWIEMAEKAMVIESCQYKYIIRTDISNFYPSVYTHIFEWIFKGYDNENLGKIIDKLVSYSNQARTNGIPIGSAMSDFLGEIILSHIDKKISEELQGMDFIGGRFKDDYRILCKSEEDAQKVLSHLNQKLQEYHLRINEEKTAIFSLPEGLYRDHMIEYENLIPNYSNEETIAFNNIEKDLKNLIYLQRKYPKTSLIEKYLSTLISKEDNLKVNFEGYRCKQTKQRVLLFISLLFYLFEMSTKSYPVVLSIIEKVMEQHSSSGYRENIAQLVIEQLKIIIQESGEKDTFVKIWTLYFIKKHRKYFNQSDTRDEVISMIENKNENENQYIKSLVNANGLMWDGNHFNSIKFFKQMKKVKFESLTQYLDLFNRE